MCNFATMDKILATECLSTFPDGQPCWDITKIMTSSPYASCDGNGISTDTTLHDVPSLNNGTITGQTCLNWDQNYAVGLGNSDYNGLNYSCCRIDNADYGTGSSDQAPYCFVKQWKSGHYTRETCIKPCHGKLYRWEITLKIASTVRSEINQTLTWPFNTSRPGINHNSILELILPNVK